MPKRLNAMHVKGHLTLSIAEWADRLGVHKQTILRWIKKEGLDVITDQRPWLIRGVDLKAFLQERSTSRKRSVGTGEMHCFGCRKSRKPADGLLDYWPQNTISGRLEGLCPECTTIMNRFIREDDIPRLYPECQVTIKRCESTLSRSTDHPVNVHKAHQPECDERHIQISINSTRKDAKDDTEIPPRK